MNIFKLTITIGVLISITACTLLETHTYPRRDTYRNFHHIYGRERAPESVEAWLNEAPDTGRLDVALRVFSYGVCKDTNSDVRLRYAKAYLRLYKKIFSGKYGYLDDVSVNDDGAPWVRHEEKIDISKAARRGFYTSLEGTYVEIHGTSAKPNAEYLWLMAELNKLPRK